LADRQIDTPYREGGWTVRQLVHHVADSHMNSFIRFRLALTESNPTIKPYNEALWADIADAKEPVEVSLKLIDSLHRRMDVMLRAFNVADWQRTLVHPENGVLTLDQMLGVYAWHSRHHVAHITELRKRMGW
jgi:exoribonuclease II